jgi:hypothetical protein
MRNLESRPSFGLGSTMSPQAKLTMRASNEMLATGLARQAIYDATDNWDFSRWWCGLLLMRLAIAHPARFMAYKPGDPGSEISTAYFLDRRS